MGIWRLGSLVASGTHAAIWLAQPADGVGNTRWDYVVRSIPAGACRVEATGQLRRFAAGAAAVRHPHLVAVLDSSLDSAEPFLVMPRLDSRSLADVIATAAPQPLPVSLWLARQVAEAAAAMHQAGWVHGDIKPQNVLLSARGHATLIDLGYACQQGQPSGGVYRGSPEFSAPEMLQGGATASAAADCFALGRILWQLLALTDRSAAHFAGFDVVADLVADLVDDQPGQRPTAQAVVDRLVRLEIETLGCHIRPSDLGAGQRRAA